MAAVEKEENLIRSCLDIRPFHWGWYCIKQLRLKLKKKLKTKKKNNNGQLSTALSLDGRSFSGQETLSKPCTQQSSVSAVARRPMCGSSWQRANMTWRSKNFLSLEIKKTGGWDLRSLLVLTLTHQLLGRLTVSHKRQQQIGTFNNRTTTPVCWSCYASVSSTKLFPQWAFASVVYCLCPKTLRATSKWNLPEFLLFIPTFFSKSTQPNYTYVFSIGDLIDLYLLHSHKQHSLRHKQSTIHPVVET